MKKTFSFEAIEATVAPSASSFCSSTSIGGTLNRAAGIIFSFGVAAVYCLVS